MAQSFRCIFKKVCWPQILVLPDVRGSRVALQNSLNDDRARLDGHQDDDDDRSQQQDEVRNLCGKFVEIGQMDRRVVLVPAVSEELQTLQRRLRQAAERAQVSDEFFGVLDVVHVDAK